jgi:hypothetical protein
MHVLRPGGPAAQARRLGHRPSQGAEDAPVTAPRATNNRTLHRPLLRPWLLVSALWIAGVVIFFESRDGKMGREVVEVIAKCLLPPLIPPLLLAALVRIVAEHCRP